MLVSLGSRSVLGSNVVHSGSTGWSSVHIFVPKGRLPWLGIKAIYVLGVVSSAGQTVVNAEFQGAAGLSKNCVRLACISRSVGDAFGVGYDGEAAVVAFFFTCCRHISGQWQ